MQKRYLTIKQTAEYLSLHPITVYRLIHKGFIPASKIGGAIRIDKEILDRWIEKKFKIINLQSLKRENE